MDHTRDPCPWVILNDFGGAFCMGVCIYLSPCVVCFLQDALYHRGALVGCRSSDAILDYPG